MRAGVAVTILLAVATATTYHHVGSQLDVQTFNCLSPVPVDRHEGNLWSNGSSQKWSEASAN
jgi:hypothetical protein